MVYGEEKHKFGNAMQCVAGKKIKGRGGEIIKGYGTIYTPGWDSSWIVASRVREKPGYATEFLMKMIPKAGRQNEGVRKNDGETE